MSLPVAALFPDWPRYASRLRDAVAGLTPEQLALRAGPDNDPIWALAAHTAGARAYWLCGVFGEPGAERTPFTDPLSGEGWEDHPEHPRSADELAVALDSTFEIVRGVLERWTLDDLGRTAERRWGDTIQVHTRASVLNRISSHDAFHAGEISQLLGLHGIGSIDLWRRTPPPT
ncbi:MAG: DinB family protein [Candidatus Limnocylindrales bacterium]